MRLLISLITASVLLLAQTASATITPVWSAGVAVPGEKVALYLIDTDVQEDAFFLHRRPAVQRARLEPLQPQAGANPLDPDRKNAEIFPLLVTPDAPGELKLPDIEVEYRSGRKEKVAVPPLPVVSTSEIRWQETPLPLGVLWHTATKEGYVDQPVKTAIKIFLPGDCEVPFAPQLHAVGVRVGSMQPAVQGVASVVQSSILPVTSAYAKGKTWRTADFSGLLTPFREGNADVGGKLTIAQRQGFFSTGRAEAEMPVLRMGALPLPPGQPADFAHAVGDFTISANSSATSLAMNEAVEVEITVRGTGDLAQLECPEPTEAEAWKLVPATRKPILDAKGETVGMVFSRLMRPTTEVRGIPSFAFSYFDPQAQEYKRAATAPLPMTWRKSDTAGSGPAVAAAEPPPAGKVPVAEMTDIYGYLSAEQYGRPLNFPKALLYVLYLPALVVLGMAAWRAASRKYAAGAAARAQERELELLAKEPDALAFLKGIGGYIESHVSPERMSPELQAVLDRRDDEAFRPAASTTLNPAEREHMMKALRKALVQVCLAAALLLPTAHAADEAEQAYKAGQFSHALQWLEQTPVPQGEEARVLYNKGNCEYRLGNSGKAALLYAQALLADPGLAEAKANLAFIQRKEGAVLPQYLPEDEVFTWLTPAQLKAASIVSTALLAFLLSLLLTRRSGNSAPLLHGAAILTTAAVLLCAANALYYATRQVPNLSAAPPADSVMVMTPTTARATADTQGASIIDFPASTPLHLLAKRGDWCYIETYSDGTRGWVRSADIAALRDGDSPRPPILLRF